MSWHYAARKVVKYDEAYYELVEVYPDIDCWTDKAVAVYGDSPADLAKWLRIAADDVESRDVIIEEDE